MSLTTSLEQPSLLKRVYKLFAFTLAISSTSCLMMTSLCVMSATLCHGDWSNAIETLSLVTKYILLLRLLSFLIVVLSKYLLESTRQCRLKLFTFNFSGQFTLFVPTDLAFNQFLQKLGGIKEVGCV